MATKKEQLAIEVAKAVGAGNQNYSYGGGVYMTGAGTVSNCMMLCMIVMEPT